MYKNNEFFFLDTSNKQSIRNPTERNNRKHLQRNLKRSTQTLLVPIPTEAKLEKPVYCDAIGQDAYFYQNY